MTGSGSGVPPILEGTGSGLRTLNNYYDDFFSIFGDFDTYVRFFLLDDLLSDGGGVRSLVSGHPLTDFKVPAFAATASEYAQYRQQSISFVTARNERVRQLSL